VRAKTCNLVGNLCRHSPYFYQHLRARCVLAPIIACCADSNPSTRKFASFAVGNAAFYDDTLCMDLRDAIPPLIRLLSDSDKTRANAAGSMIL
jgi:fused-like protein